MNKKQKILLFDSDKTYSVPLNNKLSEAGFEVVCWDEGQKPLELAKEMKADLIISEVDLPKTNAKELFKQICSLPEYKLSPFVFVSGQKKVDERIKNIELGVDDYVIKPFYIEEVVVRVKNLLAEVTRMGDDHIETEKGFSGNLAEMNLVDLIQTLELGEKSAVVKIKHGSSIGLVFISRRMASSEFSIKYETRRLVMVHSWLRDDAP